MSYILTSIGSVKLYKIKLYKRFRWKIMEYSSHTKFFSRSFKSFLKWRLGIILKDFSVDLSNRWNQESSYPTL